uniref:Uncharacterized protein n=1 Tax=Anopheles atroparvus TaxID=41427 RepID=A0A182IMW1_ANOAO
LKELDVTSAVWIGLMRPENSARFTWTSSKALDTASGYWAEAIPAMEQPLCAVVDPVRDFRWHALRCGGPETAAFLCELPVPAWAVDCTVTSIPSLTVQYMSDSGTVQLSRDCGESGTKHISCQGKQDRDSIVEQLQCSDEEDLLASVLATENNGNQLPVAQQTDGAPTRRPHLQQPILEHDILTVVSGNDEDSVNNIEVNPNQIEDTVKNVINKFNLQDLMRSEQAALHSDEAGGAGGIRDAPGIEDVRKTGVHGKKYSPLYEKKDRYAKKSAADEDDEDDEPMMGDQPMVDELETQPIDIVQQAVKPTADGDYADPAAPVVEVAKPDGGAASTTVKPDAAASTPDSRLRRATDADGAAEIGSSGTTEALTTPAGVTEPGETISTSTTAVPSTSAPPALHATRTTAASHVLPTTPKKEVITGDHFIPPMLLVKARFISARPHTEPPATTMLPTTTPSATTLASVDRAVSDGPPTTGSLSSTTLETGTDEMHQVLQTAVAVAARSASEPTGTMRSPLATAGPDSSAAPEPQALASSVSQDAEIESASSPSEQQATVTDSTTPEPPMTVAASASSSIVELAGSSDGCVQLTTVTVIANGGAGSVADSNAIATAESPAAAPVDHALDTFPQRTAEANASAAQSGTHVKLAVHDVPAEGDSHAGPTGAEPPYNGHEQAEDDEQDHLDEHEQHSDLHNSFSNIENYQPYKPNRHRSLTKPEVHSNHGGAYIKKILG